MRPASLVTIEFKLLQLRDSYSKRVTYFAKSGSLSLHWCPCYLFQKISPKGIVALTNRTIRIANKLRHKMQVTNRVKDLRQFPKVPIGSHLFNVSLAQTLLIAQVILVRPAQDLKSVPHDSLGLDDRALIIVLIKFEFVLPGWTFGCTTHLHMQ